MVKMHLIQRAQTGTAPKIMLLVVGETARAESFAEWLRKIPTLNSLSCL